MLRLLSNMSNALEQIHTFKTSVMAQLTVQANMNTDMHAYILCYTEVTYYLYPPVPCFFFRKFHGVWKWPGLISDILMIKYLY